MKPTWKKYLLYGSAIIIGGTLVYILIGTVRAKSSSLETIQAYVTLIKDIITGLAALTAAVIAIMGLQTWKKQLKGKTEYELAQRGLRATYQLRGALALVRFWIIDEVEVFHAMKELGTEGSATDNAKAFARTRKAVYQKRWQKVQEATIEFDSFSLEAEAIWGPDVKEKLYPLLQCGGTLYASLMVYLEDLEHPRLNYSKELRNKDRQIIFGTPDDKDNFFSNEVAAAVRKIEDFLKPYLKM